MYLDRNFGLGLAERIAKFGLKIRSAKSLYLLT